MEGKVIDPDILNLAVASNKLSSGLARSGVDDVEVPGTRTELLASSNSRCKNCVKSSVAGMTVATKRSGSF